MFIQFFQERSGLVIYQYFHSLQKFRKPITAYAIFTEPGGVKRSSVFKINCGNTTLQYKFNTYKIALQDDDALMNHPNPFALVVLIARQNIIKRMYKDKVVHDEKLLASKLQIARLIFERRLSPEKESNLIKFLFYNVDFEIKETNTTFERSIQLLTHKNIEDTTMEEAILEEKKFEGLREGLEKGRKEGQQLGKTETLEAMVTRMIQMQLLSDEQIVKIAEVPLGFVRRLRKKLKKIN